ncbi:hypothetical protein PILCRDRAFT_61453, partial [Piloderma croceum F 1598]
GRFLLVALHMDSLSTKLNCRAVHNTLDTLPAEVDATYTEAMTRIAAQIDSARELAKRILAWITYACRPLLLNELQHALATFPRMTDMDSGAIVPEQILTSVCAGLVAIDENSGTVRLVHYTAQNYFECNAKILFPDAEVYIATTCLRYLSFDAFGNDDYLDLPSRLYRSPLLQYAAAHWGDHARRRNFLKKKVNVACAIAVLLGGDQSHIPYWQAPKAGFSVLHLLSLFGLETTVDYQLESGTTADLRDSKGHEGVVKLHLTRGDVDVNLKDCGSRTPLSHAAEKGYEGVVRLLLTRGDVDVNSVDNRNRTPLSHAAEKGHEGMVRLLLTRGDVEVNLENCSSRTPLSQAAEKGREGVVRLLLTRDDVDVNSMDYSNRTPLSHAAEKGHEGVVRLLLTRSDVEVNLTGGWCDQTPLLYAASNGHEGVVRLLLTRGDTR